MLHHFARSRPIGRSDRNDDLNGGKVNGIGFNIFIEPVCILLYIVIVELIEIYQN